MGNTQHGGDASERFQLTSGFSNDSFDVVFGIKLYKQDPIGAYQRDYTNPRLDSPGNPSDINASPVFTCIDGDGNYLDPGHATCAGLSHLDRDSVF